MEKRDLMGAVPTDAIPREVAFRLCEGIRQENRGKWFRWTAWMCWGCTTFCKGDLTKMCVGSQPDHRGCIQVNARYDRNRQQEAKGR